MAERVKWFEDQAEEGQHNNWNANSPIWPNAIQGYTQPSRTTLPQAQPIYSWQPQGFSNQDREPSLKELRAQLAQSNQATTVQLAQLAQLAQRNQALINTTAQPHAQSSSLLQPQAFSNQDRELPELKEVVAKMVQSQVSMSAQLTQFITQQIKTNEAFNTQIGSITDTIKELLQIGKLQGKANEVFSADLKELRSQLGKVVEEVNERERSYEDNRQGLDAEVMMCARNDTNERSVRHKGLETEENDDAETLEYMKLLVDSPVDKFEHVLEPYERPAIDKAKPLVDTSQPMLALVDDFDEDLRLCALFAEEEKDNVEELVFMEPLPEDQKPSKLKSVTNAFKDEFIDSTDTPPFSVVAGTCDEEKPKRTPIELKPLPPDPLRYEFLYETNALPVFLFAGLLGMEDELHVEKKCKTGIGTKAEEPHVANKRKTGIGVPKQEKSRVWKKRKKGIGVQEQKFILDDKVQPYIVPQRRFIDMKKEVNRKEIIK